MAATNWHQACGPDQETEKDDLPTLAALPGLTVALAEDLLSEMSFAEVIKMGAAAVAHSLGLGEIKSFQPLFCIGPEAVDSNAMPVLL